ncbi:MAG: hypothetical protein KDC38_21815, partial [Planctomycetes bacterium]|nr:hypothetical protein [Planctomycetota bacterium]
MLGAEARALVRNELLNGLRVRSGAIAEKGRVGIVGLDLARRLRDNVPRGDLAARCRRQVD